MTLTLPIIRLPARLPLARALMSLDSASLRRLSAPPRPMVCATAAVLLRTVAPLQPIDSVSRLQAVAVRAKGAGVAAGGVRAMSALRIRREKVNVVIRMM